MTMKRLNFIHVAVMVAIIMMVGGLVGCGGTSKSTCDCAICINDVPAYPCDSDESCANFATNQGCDSYTLANDPTETCGDNPQPVCRVTGCEGQCQCPDV